MRWLVLALVFLLAGLACQCEPVAPPQRFACDAGSQCRSGWSCVLGECVEDAPDAGQ